MSKPKFFQAVLVPVENVLEHAYPQNVQRYGSPMVTMTERMGSEEARCPECGKNTWWLQPVEGAAVREGGKSYIECMECGYQTHL